MSGGVLSFSLSAPTNFFQGGWGESGGGVLLAGAAVVVCVSCVRFAFGFFHVMARVGVGDCFWVGRKLSCVVD